MALLRMAIYTPLWNGSLSLSISQSLPSTDSLSCLTYNIWAVVSVWWIRRIGCVRFNVPLDTFLDHFGDGGVTAASARIIATASAEASSIPSAAPQCVRCWVVCAGQLDNSGVYVYYLKGIVSVCFRCPARTVGFSGTRLYFCTYNQPSWATLKCCLPPGMGRSTRGLQPGGHVHKEAVHLLSLQPASITSLGAFKPECNGLSQFREDTGLYACPRI